MAFMPSKDAPTATQTGTTVSGQPIVGSDIKYVNPLICSLTGKYCDPNEGIVSSSIVGMFQGTPVVKTGYGYTVTPVGQITTRFCEDPTLQTEKAQALVDKLNKGLPATDAELAWAKECEPTLYNMIR